jgi:S1-C subfamily serine protease
MKNIFKFTVLFLLLASSINVYAEGALANDGNAYGSSFNASDTINAEKIAIENCKKSGGVNCKVIGAFAHSCIAIAKDRQLQKSAYSIASNLDEAKSVSIQRCIQAGGINCVNTPNQGCDGNVTTPSPKKETPSIEQSLPPTQSVKAPPPATPIRGSGTAWQVSPNQLVTAYHVVAGAKSMGIVINDEIKPAKLIAADPSNDLALVQLLDSTLSTKPLQLANKPPALGARVAAIGYPLTDLLGYKVQATSGEISKLSGPHDDLRFYQISAAIQSGNSGGPLLNKQGEVLGVITLKTNITGGEIIQNVNFAVKYPYVATLLESAGVNNTKSQKKISRIEDAISQSKDSVYLLEVLLEKK